jgi:hypothetical protein
MTDERRHRHRPPQPRSNGQAAQNPQAPAQKAPETLPGPNRQHDTARYGEALAPGTIPDEERRKRERQEREKPDNRASRP